MDPASGTGHKFLYKGMYVCMCVAVLNTWTVCMAFFFVCCVQALVVIDDDDYGRPGAHRSVDVFSRKGPICPPSVVERRPLHSIHGDEGLRPPMETKSRLKVTVGRDPGLPPSASSVERASPPRLSSSRPAHCTRDSADK